MKKRLSFLIFFFLLLSFSVNAQVEGGVTDAADKAIPGAMIIATDSTGRLLDSVISDKRGFYSFQKLRLGKYRIVAKAAGYKTAVYENVIVLHEETRERDISGATRLDIVLAKNR